jgi:hypothetical protein
MRYDTGNFRAVVLSPFLVLRPLLARHLVQALIHNTAKQLAAGNHADDFILGWHLIHKRVETRLIRSAFLVRRHFPEQEYI